ncbi:unnamed protein product [Lymnaea stagnalis]|uniref:Uncharacterized protein n=1 Tax=Lymnaea stagnalis TaxID=6523 RepID=A0AAV2IJT3_LYMST
MTVIKTSSVTKLMGDGPGLTALNFPPDSGSPSPIGSVTPSQGSHAMLIPSITHAKDDAKSKRKKILNQTKNLNQQRLKNILWLLLITSLFALIVCVAITLVNSLHDNFLFRERGTSESVICQPSGKCETKSKRMRDFKSIEMIETRSESDGHRCIHRRSIMDEGIDNSEIIHDLSTKWSAIVEHDDQRCLIFDMRDLEVSGCPKEYPWSLDMRIGIPVCKTSLDQIAPIRRVLRHILDDNLQNTTFAGYLTAKLCSLYKSAVVDKVIVQYFDADNNRIVKRSVLAHVEEEKGGLNEGKKGVAKQKRLRRKRSVKMGKNLKRLTGKHEEENSIKRVYRSLDRKYLFTAPDDDRRQRRNAGRTAKIPDRKKHKPRINIKAIRLFYTSRKAKPNEKTGFERKAHNANSNIKWSRKNHPYGHLKWPKSTGFKNRSRAAPYKGDKINPVVGGLHNNGRKTVPQRKPRDDQGVMHKKQKYETRADRNVEMNIKGKDINPREKRSIIDKNNKPSDAGDHGDAKAKKGKNKPKMLLSIRANTAPEKVGNKSNHKYIKKEQKQAQSGPRKSVLEDDIIFGHYNPHIPGHWELVYSEIGRNGIATLAHKLQLPNNEMEKNNEHLAVREIHNLITAAVEADLHKILEEKEDNELHL